MSAEIFKYLDPQSCDAILGPPLFVGSGWFAPVCLYDEKYTSITMLPLCKLCIPPFDIVGVNIVAANNENNQLAELLFGCTKKLAEEIHEEWKSELQKNCAHCECHSTMAQWREALEAADAAKPPGGA